MKSLNLRKAMALLLVMCMLVFEFSSVPAYAAGRSISKITVKNNGATLDEGQKLTKANAKKVLYVKVAYSDGTQKNNYSSYKVKEVGKVVKPNSKGIFKCTVLAGKKSKAVYVKVNKITSINTVSKNNLSLVEGQSFDVNAFKKNINVYAKYQNGAKKKITTYTVSAKNVVTANSDGNFLVTVKYGKYKNQIAIPVTKKETTEQPTTEETTEEPYISTYDGRYGSAGNIDGTTVIVSIFADEQSTKWDMTSSEDLNTMNDTIESLQIATDFLVEGVAEYNKKAKFIYDWSKYPDLKYTASFQEDLIRDGVYSIEANYIERNIDGEALKKKYRADNIIYMFFFNTDYSNTENSGTYSYWPNNLHIELINIYVRYKNRFVDYPALYAHEILHTFGAPDIYCANQVITQEYVDYCKEIDTDDIMYVIRSFGSTIFEEFTELDAYYVGLIDKSSDVQKFNLGLNERN